MKKIKIRKATSKDAPQILGLIKKIAEFEKLSHEVTATTQTLKRSLFGKQKFANVLLAEWDNEVIAYAIYFFNFSTFKGRPGLYLEDLFVLPEHRSMGIGLILLKQLAKIAQQKKCARMEWMVLDWNQRAIQFYEKLGAEIKKEWLLNRLTEDNIKRLARS